MAQPTSLSSNNPFRRNGPRPSVPSPIVAPPFPDSLDSEVAPSMPSSDQFRAQLQALPHSDLPLPATSFQKPKVVKKVRVQSPPPSSPESAGAPERYSRRDLDSEDSFSSSDDGQEEIYDPFNIMPPTAPDESADTDVGPESSSHPFLDRAPPNPFQRTLQDLELGSNEVAQDVESPAGTRGALDVDAFKRLLLTGQAGGKGDAQIVSPISASVPAQGAHLPVQVGDGASLTDTSSVSRQSISDATYPPTHDTPRTSHEISEPEGDDDRHGLIGNGRPKAQSPATLRKKPPPPSSRHGKLIKMELKGRDPHEASNASSSSASPRAAKGPASPPQSMGLPRPSTPLEVNKPLPPAPQRHPTEEEAESVFDREAAGKVPEPAGEFVEEPLPLARPPTPPKPSQQTPTQTSGSPNSSRKPPPPPRRTPHGRSESKASILVTAPVTSQHNSLEELDTLPRRSSQDSTRSRSSSLRVSVHAPAPPPPRRPAHNSRPSTSFISPSTVSFSSVPSTGSEKSPSEAPELSPHPPGITAAITSSSSQTPSPHVEASSSVAESSTSPPLHHGTVHPKLFPPPPPPARNASTRSKRPPSVLSMDATSRRVGTPLPPPPPPPPPPRQRGSSKGSVDGSELAARKASTDNVRILEDKLAEEPALASITVEKTNAPNILADLTALQREVDALRGKVEKAET